MTVKPVAAMGPVESMAPGGEMNASDEADLIVIGAGLAGHSAALAAAEAGARVLVLEKEPRSGGSTVLSGGFFALAGTGQQRAAGITDTPDLLLRDLIAVGGTDIERPLVEAYAAGQAEFIDWLQGSGAAFTALELSAGQSVARSHRCDTSELLAHMARKMDATGRVGWMRNTNAIRLLREGGSGPVTGVASRNGAGGERDLRATGGVVIATGGFSRSEELLRIFAPAQAGALRVGGEGSTGDGLRMAWRLGAGLRDMGQVKGTFGTHPSTGTERHEILLAFYVGAIIVNREGRRFVDESDSYKIIGDACLGQTDRVGFQIFDQTVMDRSDPGVPLFDFEPALARGLLVRSDTLAALAEATGIPPGSLEDTVAEYNGGVQAGCDRAFARRGLCNGAGERPPVAIPPFYAYPSTSVVLATYCGLHVAADGQVRDVDGQDIEGLFAAGEVTGGFHGRSYMTGSSLGKAAFFGRAAGRAAAARARQMAR